MDVGVLRSLPGQPLCAYIRVLPFDVIVTTTILIPKKNLLGFGIFSESGQVKVCCLFGFSGLSCMSGGLIGAR